MINTSLFALFGRYKGDASLAGVLENIQRGTYKQFIDEMREALASGDKELAAKLKKKLPAFTPQATYSGKRLDPHITRYNQLVVLDIDHVGERELERITPLATEAPYTVAYFRSPSGDGAKLIAYAATDETATPGNHRRVYEAMSRWYAARLGVELDTSGSDIGRLCFVSDDPALYLSPAYRPWLESVTVPVTFLACWEMDTFALDAWIGGVTPAPTIRKQSAKPSPLLTKANCLFIITQK